MGILKKMKAMILRQLKDELIEGRRDGVKCPVCAKHCKEWTKSIISTSAAELCKLVSIYEGEPVHHDDFALIEKDRNFSQLVLWGLIEPGVNEDDDKRASGTWSPTKLGIDFAEGKVKIRKYVTTFNNAIVPNPPEYDETIDIEEALRDKFSYKELMER